MGIGSLGHSNTARGGMNSHGPRAKTMKGRNGGKPINENAPTSHHHEQTPATTEQGPHQPVGENRLNQWDAPGGNLMSNIKTKGDEQGHQATSSHSSSPGSKQTASSHGKSASTTKSSMAAPPPSRPQSAAQTKGNGSSGPSSGSERTGGSSSPRAAAARSSSPASSHAQTAARSGATGAATGGAGKGGSVTTKQPDTFIANRTGVVNARSISQFSSNAGIVAKGISSGNATMQVPTSPSARGGTVEGRQVTSSDGKPLPSFKYVHNVMNFEYHFHPEHDHPHLHTHRHLPHELEVEHHRPHDHEEEHHQTEEGLKTEGFSKGHWQSRAIHARVAIDSRGKRVMKEDIEAKARGALLGANPDLQALTHISGEELNNYLSDLHHLGLTTRISLGFNDLADQATLILGPKEIASLPDSHIKIEFGKFTSNGFIADTPSG